MNLSNIFLACAVCFGDPTSPLSKGVAAGVIFLGALIIFVLFSIFGIAFKWSQRAKQLNSQQ